jgi:hypothetical protein
MVSSSDEEAYWNLDLVLSLVPVRAGMHGDVWRQFNHAYDAREEIEHTRDSKCYYYHYVHEPIIGT